MGSATIFKVTTESQDTYETFATETEATEFLRSELAGFWRLQEEVFRQDLGDMPADLEAAQATLSGLYTDGSWDRYQVDRLTV